MKLGAMRPAPVVLVAGVAIVWTGAVFGLWWIPVAVGLAAGMLVRPGKLAVLISLVAGAAGWAGPLAWQSLSVDILRTASVVSGIMGAGSNGWTIVLFSVFLAALLCGAGAWLSIAVGGLVRALRATSGTARSGRSKARTR